MNWPAVQLDILCARIDTHDPRRQPNEHIEYIDLSAIDQVTKQITGASHIQGADAPSRARQLLAAGDVLVSTVRPNLNAVAVVDEQLSGATGSTGFSVLRPKQDELDGRYLFQWVKSPAFIEEMVAQATGASYPAVSNKIVRSSAIPLPPLPEQRRIAAILDHADTLRAKRKQSLGLLDTLSRAVFVQMFGDPRKSESNTLLGDVAEFYAGGTLPDGETFAGQSGGYQLLKVSDLNLSGNETFLKSSVLWSAKGGARAATCPTGSVVIPKRGGAIGTNKKRLTVRSAVLDPNLMGIAPIDEFLISDFLFGWFQFLDLASIQSGSSVPQLNKRDLAPLAIGIPDLAEQREFGRRVGRIRSLATNGASLLDTCEALFRSVQSRAFRGEL